MMECEICLETYQEGTLELHRKSCVLQLILRCSICNEDYVSREGLWNHLDVHEISDDSKETYCQELKAKHKLHQCALCNDQRGYSESSYEMHMHDFHSSEAQGGTVDSEVNTPEHKPEAIERRKRKVQSTKSSERRNQRLKEKPRVSFGSDTGNNLNSDSELSTANANRKKSTKVREQCTSCGNIYSSRKYFDRHKKTCSVSRQYECQFCTKTYRCKTDYSAHYKICKQRMYLCSLCGRTFKSFKSVKYHITTNHPQTGCLDTVQIVPKQVRSKVRKKKTSLEDTAVPAPDNGEQSTMDVLDSQPNAASCDNGSMERQTASNDNRSKEKEVASVNRKRSFPCLVCDRNFNCYNSFAKHRMAEHTEAKYQCTLCSKKYIHKRNLDAHTCDKGKRTKCDLCDRWFLNPKNLQSHKKTQHLLKTKVLETETRAGLDDTIKVKDEPLENDEEISSSDQEATEVLQCQMCEKRFRNKRALGYHTTAAHTEPQFECSQCQKKFLDVRFLRNHQKCASKTRCQKCDINFCTRYQLVYHCAEKHPEDCTLKDLAKYKINEDNPPDADGIPWPCSICNQLFRTKKQQQYHVNKHHKEPKYNCCFCGKMFHFRNKRHEEVCLATRCQECDIVFTTRDLLKKHKLNMHPEDGKSNNSETTTTGTVEKEIKVEDRKGMLKSLERRNDSIVSQTAKDQSSSCSICGLTFPSAYRVWYHKALTHAPPKFKCPYCQKAFHFQRNLDRHEKTCSKMRCRRCNIMFPSRAMLDIHNKNMHPTDDEPMNVDAEEELVSEIKIEEERLPEDAEEFAL